MSSLGDGLLTVALPLLALTLTRDPVAIAGVVVASRLARAVFAVPGGVVVDRYERHRVMIVCMLVAGVALALLVADLTWGSARLSVLYAVAVAVSAADVVYGLAAQAVVPSLVAPSDLAMGNSSLMLASGGGEQFVGPAVGGLVFSVSQRLPFLGDSLSFVAAAAMLSAPGRRAPGRGAPAGGTVLPSRTGPWREQVAEGFRAYRSTPALWRVTMVVASVGFSQNAVFGLLVLFGRRQLHLGGGLYGLFVALAASLGMLGLYVGAPLQRRFGSAAVLVSGGALCGLSFVGLSLVRWWPLAVVVLGAQELGAATASVASSTARQRLVPPQFYGRAFSVHRLVVGLAAPLGALTGGLVAGAAGVPTSFVVSGVLALGLLTVVGPGLLIRLRPDGRGRHFVPPAHPAAPSPLAPAPAAEEGS